MPLSNLFPSLPWPIVITVFNVVGFMGAIAFIYAVLLEQEKRQDAVFVVASASLFVYSLAVNNVIFMFLSAGVFLVAGRELIQILRGKHHHSTDDKEKTI
ncbi:MAG: hypothetical protein HY983_01685 [Candidatus Magasanikbacteria bacterium]|nr:hypothetical protein [Candidatus Magasanikbacteria bacterium]